jgi:hypothetical protein
VALASILFAGGLGNWQDVRFVLRAGAALGADVHEIAGCTRARSMAA